MRYNGTMPDHADLSGLTAVVTGSSSGIGRAIARELAAGGAAVLVHARSNSDAAMETSGEVRKQGVDSTVELLDLADEAAHEALVAAAWQWRGNVDIWINNAGADVLTGEAARWPFERKLAQLWRVDVTATVRLSKLAGARMKARGSGTIINMGWDQAEHGMAGDSGELFSTTKGAVMAFTKSLARSLAPDVRVNCLAPGWIRTSWGQQAGGYWQARAVGESLLARWGTPQDVARVARFLASPAAGFVTGQTIIVNGGHARFHADD
jgi:3-oxoacyl-[acyl-carrier protein] reductase